MLLTIILTVWITLFVVHVSKEMASPYYKPDGLQLLFDFIFVVWYNISDIIDEWHQWAEIKKRTGGFIFTTKDGVTKQIGDLVYYEAFSNTLGENGGMYYVAHTRIDDLDQAFGHVGDYWHDKQLCQQQCDTLNSDLKVTLT